MRTICEAIDEMADELVREILENQHPMFQLQIGMAPGPVKAVSFLLLKSQVLTVIAAAAIQRQFDDAYPTRSRNIMPS